MEAQKLKTRKEISQELGISTRTFNRWVHKHELAIPSGLVCPKLQKMIKSRFLLEEVEDTR